MANLTDPEHERTAREVVRRWKQANHLYGTADVDAATTGNLVQRIASTLTFTCQALTGKVDDLRLAIDDINAENERLRADADDRCDCPCLPGCAGKRSDIGQQRHAPSCMRGVDSTVPCTCGLL